MDTYNIPSSIITNANRFRHNNIQTRMIKDYIIDILKKIDDEINIAHNNGQEFVNTTLPIIFDVPNVSNATLQRIIWSSIMEELICKNFEVKIKHSESFCMLSIMWIKKEDKLLVDHQNRLIAKYSV